MESNIKELLSRDSIQRLVGKGVSVTFLGKGLFNLNYMLESEKGRFVFRVSVVPSHFRFKKNEYTVLNLVRDLGIAPRAYYFDDSMNFFEYPYMIIDYVSGEVCTAEQLDEARLSEVARAFSVLHEKEHQYLDPLSFERVDFSVFHEIDRYASYIDMGNFRQEELSYVRDLFGYIDDLRLVKMPLVNKISLLKGDNKVSNIIWTGTAVKFIDWEFAKTGVAELDIANFLNFAGLDSHIEEYFLEEYQRFGGKISSLGFYRRYDLVLKALWALQGVRREGSERDSSFQKFMEKLTMLRQD